MSRHAEFGRSVSLDSSLQIWGAFIDRGMSWLWIGKIGEERLRELEESVCVGLRLSKGHSRHGGSRGGIVEVAVRFDR